MRCVPPFEGEAVIGSSCRVDHSIRQHDLRSAEWLRGFHLQPNHRRAIAIFHPLLPCTVHHRALPRDLRLIDLHTAAMSAGTPELCRGQGVPEGPVPVAEVVGNDE